MKLKLIMVCFLVASIIAMAVPQVLAHSHIETGTGQEVVLPDSYHGDATRGLAGFGIGVAKGGIIGPFGAHFPGPLEDFPTQSADSAIIGGGATDPINVK